MKNHLRLSAAAIVLLSALAVSPLTPCPAQAGNDALNVTSAKTTLPQAISAAEQKVGGTAAKAAYKHKKGQYKVEVVKDTEVYDVMLTPTTEPFSASKRTQKTKNQAFGTAPGQSPRRSPD